jgi:hypothetical protein
MNHRSRYKDLYGKRRQYQTHGDTRMSRIGVAYGSEYHLRTSLVKNRSELNEQVLKTLVQDGCPATASIEWLPNYLVAGMPESRGMDFLPQAGGEAWKEYWPDPKAGRDETRQGIHNWDAVGRVSFAGHCDWLLVEAKAHIREFIDSPICGAKRASRQTITQALQKTRLWMGLTDSLDAPVPESWFSKGGYQIVNRFASLAFVLNEAQPRTSGRLLFIYYLNDQFSDRNCPKDLDEWWGVIKRKYEELGIPPKHGFKTRTHYLFIDLNKR